MYTWKWLIILSDFKFLKDSSSRTWNRSVTGLNEGTHVEPDTNLHSARSGMLGKESR